MNTKRQTTQLILIALSLIFFITSCANSPEQRLIGEWKGTDPTGVTAALVFNEDGSARMIQGNTVLDGASVGGKVTWRLDASHDPMRLDLVLSKTSGETMTLPMILRFVGENKLQARISEDRTSRPTGFSESEDTNQIILVRQ